MMRRNARWQQVRPRGITLPELMMAMVIMVLIMGVLGGIYFSSLQVWRRCSAQSQADPPAHISLDRVTSELRNAYKVNSVGTSSISFDLPVKSGTAPHPNLIPFQSWCTIRYYLSDDTGSETSTGTYLWRKKTDTATGDVSSSVIARNVESLTFAVDSSDDRILKVYAMSIAIVGEEGRQQYTSSFSGTVAFRNPASS
jgi:prepilin-type N-terminal cleavage/methylation domain-containing protein